MRRNTPSTLQISVGQKVLSKREPGAWAAYKLMMGYAHSQFSPMHLSTGHLPYVIRRLIPNTFTDTTPNFLFRHRYTPRIGCLEIRSYGYASHSALRGGDIEGDADMTGRLLFRTCM